MKNIYDFEIILDYIDIFPNAVFNHKYTNRWYYIYDSYISEKFKKR